MSERFVRIGIEIPLSLYANLYKIKNGSAASGRILEAVRNGYDAKAINIAIRALGSSTVPDRYDEGYNVGFDDGYAVGYIAGFGDGRDKAKCIEEDNNG